MRLLIATGLYPPEIGGPATYARLFEERLPSYGIEVSVLPFRTVRSLPPVIRHIVYCWKIMRSARNANAILVQDTVSTGFPAAIASLIIRKPLILRVPGDYAWERGVQRFGVRENLDEFQNRSYGFPVGILRAIQRFVVRRARRVIAPSRYLAGIILGWVPSKEIDVIYNGIGIADAPRSERKKDLIVSSGRLVPWKGFKELIDSIAHTPHWKLHILGSGPEKEKLEDYTWEMGVEKNVTFRGSVSRSEALQAFAEATVFVLNSRYEGLSHTLLEAMSTGAPIIATRVGGNPEVIRDGVNGVLVTAGDTVALEKALTHLMSDAALRERLGSAARDRAKDFSIEKTIEVTASLLKSCVS